MTILRWLLAMLAGVLLLGIIAHGQITPVNRVPSGTGTTSINATGANLVLVLESAPNGGQVVPTASGLTFTACPGCGSAYGGANNTMMYVSQYNPGVGTVTVSAGTNPIDVRAYSGVASGPSCSASILTPDSPFNTGSITPPNPNMMVISYMGQTDPSGTTTGSSTLNNTDYINGTTAVFGFKAAVGGADQIQTTATTVNPQWTSSGGYFNGQTCMFYSILSPATLTILTTSYAEGFVSVPYSQLIQAAGGVENYSCSLTAGTLPAGLSLVGCTIQGTPTSAISATPITIKVTDNVGTMVSTGALPLTIAATPLQFTTSTCPGGTQGTAYAGCTLGLTGGTSPYTCSYSTSQDFFAIPDGLTINSSTCAVSGTVTGQGTYDDTEFIATDSLGATTTQSISFAMAGNNSWLANPMFPSDSVFSLNVSALPVDTSPAAAPLGYPLEMIFGNDLSNGGFALASVPSTQPQVTMTINGGATNYFPGGTAPYSTTIPIEATSNNSNCVDYIGDGHTSVTQLDGSGNPRYLYEMFSSQYSAGWCGQGTGYWDLHGYTMGPQDSGFGTDAAGLPLANYIFNYDAVLSAGGQRTAVRFTVPTTAHYPNYVWPATGHSSGYGACSGGYSDSNGLLSQNGSGGSGPPTSCSGSISHPYGEIYRLKASVTTPSACSSDPQALSMVGTFRNYGIISADNSGLYVIGIGGTVDTRWHASAIAACFAALSPGGSIATTFEPVNVQSVALNWAGYSAQTTVGTPPQPSITGSATITGSGVIQ